jgi:hypothetical protein
MRYFITFACYGDICTATETGSVDRLHNLPRVDCWSPTHNAPQLNAS